MRKKSIEWLNANVPDNQTKIKYFIKSLADPDNSIQAFAHDLIKKYPEDYLGFIYGYAKDIHIAEIQVTGKKVPLANLKKNVEEMYAHIQELLLNN